MMPARRPGSFFCRLRAPAAYDYLPRDSRPTNSPLTANAGPADATSNRTSHARASAARSPIPGPAGSPTGPGHPPTNASGQQSPSRGAAGTERNPDTPRLRDARRAARQTHPQTASHSTSTPPGLSSPKCGPAQGTDVIDQPARSLLSQLGALRRDLGADDDGEGVQRTARLPRHTRCRRRLHRSVNVRQTLRPHRRQPTVRRPHRRRGIRSSQTKQRLTESNDQGSPS
jgi:hypothetical protein